MAEAIQKKPKNNLRKFTYTGLILLGVLVITFLFILIAFVSANWLKTDDRYYGSRFFKLGLWTHCFRSLPNPEDEYGRRYFTGCRWVFNPFTTGYDEIRWFLVPGFMVAVQLFFTLCFIGTVLVTILLLTLSMQCWRDHLQVKILFLMSIICGVSGFCGTLAIIVFGAMANQEGWMPDPDHNYLSWSYGLAVVGSFGLFVSSGLAWVEYGIQRRKYEAIQNGGIPMQQKI